MCSLAAAAATELRVVALRQRPDEGVGSCDATCLVDRSVRYGGVAEREVVRHGPGKQLHDLRDDAKHAAALRLIEPCWIAARDTDAPAPWAVQASQQVQDAGLAGPGTSDQGHVLTALHRERDTVQHRVLFGVAKLDV